MRFARASGVLLHPTSLPGPHGSGDLGASAYHFVDWLVTAGQRCWQVLPLGHPGEGSSPYMSDSAFAGNPLLVDLHELHARGWLAHDDLVPDPGFEIGRIRFERVVSWRRERLDRAARAFDALASSEERAQFDAFRSQHAHWLEDYTLFKALEDEQSGKPWCDWPTGLARRESSALESARDRLARPMRHAAFMQWCFFRQWQALRRYANDRGISIIGDAPIFVAWQSADVWAQPALFELDAEGRPEAVAGVPPDYFSATGQRWGNPLYRWSAHAQHGFRWWIERVRSAFELVDILRIDHFRGFAAFWRIPVHEATALNGQWVLGPGAALFEALARELGPLPIIAEDLGTLTPDVVSLRHRFDLPGMRVLQFAWNGDAGNAYLPHNHERDSVVYTGTHDNDTAVGWWTSIEEGVRRQVCDYLGIDGREIHWALIRAACASVADTAIYPLQDILGLDGRHRMNVPGQPNGCWGWRFHWGQFGPEPARRLASLCRLYGRGAGGKTP